MTEHADTIRLDRAAADELAESVRALGAWLYQAPEHLRRDFARHAFPDPTAPGATCEDFLLSLHHAWQQLCAALPDNPGRDEPGPSTFAR
jgi:hypothetical protein